jgi:hypothetical protein
MGDGIFEVGVIGDFGWGWKGGFGRFAKRIGGGFVFENLLLAVKKKLGEGFNHDENLSSAWQ